MHITPSAQGGLPFGFADPRVAADPGTVRRFCDERLNDRIVRDEYGEFFTGRQFLFMLESNCPIEYTENIGRWFR